MGTTVTYTPIPKDQMICKNCEFWNYTNINHRRGDCRRRAPGGPYPYNEAISSKMMDIWPRTEPDETCGEWMEKRS